MAAPVQQLVKHWPAVLAEADDLAVQDRVRAFQSAADRFTKGRAPTESTAVPRDEACAAVLDVGDRAKAIVLDLKDPVVAVERLADLVQRHGPDCGKRGRQRIQYSEPLHCFKALRTRELRRKDGGPGRDRTGDLMTASQKIRSTYSIFRQKQKT